MIDQFWPRPGCSAHEVIVRRQGIAFVPGIQGYILEMRIVVADEDIEQRPSE